MDPILQPSDHAEQWCRQCESEAVVMVETTTGRQYLCFPHGADLAYKLTAPSWKRRVAGVEATEISGPPASGTSNRPVAPETESERRAAYGDR